jgi:hypothetical protein
MACSTLVWGSGYPERLFSWNYSLSAHIFLDTSYFQIGYSYFRPNIIWFNVWIIIQSLHVVWSVLLTSLLKLTNKN